MSDVCTVCQKPKATPANGARHEAEGECRDPFRHWCQALCWCPDIHHALQEPGWCDICHPQQDADGFRKDGSFELTDGSACPKCGSTWCIVLDQTIGCAHCNWVDWPSWDKDGNSIEPLPRVIPPKS